jgi:hypothetical protein
VNSLQTYAPGIVASVIGVTRRDGDIAHFCGRAFAERTLGDSNHIQTASSRLAFKDILGCVR